VLIALLTAVYRKSTYIKQVALLTVLGQIGCFVPAQQAVIPLRDRLLSRIGMADDMENNLSTFHTEMKETSYVLDNATSKSLG
jgi:DNA mismatch repair ATPase MutS